MMQKNNILLCVSGGIAVYKAVALVSKLSQAGMNVKVIMTESARQFVNPLSFQVMSKNDVFYDTFDEKDSSVIAHIDLADWADLVLVAPATANVIGKLANGIADDMVTTTLLATTAPVWIAPAMNVHMYDHPAVKRNIAQLAEDGYAFIEPSEGFLACGYVGKGRLEEPEKITELVVKHFMPKQLPLQGMQFVLTAGPTIEKLDNAHFISSNNSGELGYALAYEVKKSGALVDLVSGPVSVTAPAGVRVVNVQTEDQMCAEIKSRLTEQSIFIHTASGVFYRKAPEVTFLQALSNYYVDFDEANFQARLVTDVGSQSFEATSVQALAQQIIAALFESRNVQ